jgi:hypothetical protein
MSHRAGRLRAWPIDGTRVILLPFFFVVIFKRIPGVQSKYDHAPNTELDNIIGRKGNP